MNVELRTEGPPRVWHRRLGERLAADGHTLVVTRVPAAAPARFGAVLAAEQRLYKAASVLFAPADAGPASNVGRPDLVLDARFDGVTHETGLVAALLARRPPRVDIVAVSADAPCVLASGLPAVEDRSVLARSLDHVLARTIDLAVQAVRQAIRGCGGLGGPEPASATLKAGPVTFLGRGLIEKVARRVRRSQGPEHWQIALGRTRDGGDRAALGWDGPAILPLADDRGRFRADPFPFVHAGRTFLFYEDFPYDTRKGVIAAVEIDAAGAASPPRVVLELPVHLSYPNVFAIDGHIYMMPEMSAAGRIQLFRADPLPDRWVPDHLLVDDVVAADATMIAHDGRWWLFATLAGDGGSSWDALGLFYAPHPFGPWRPHAGNPVLIDAGSARPAGAMWHADGALMRVAQDCRGGYGDGLAICRVDRLDPDGYAQTVLSRLGAPPGSGADGVHTLNRAGGLEAIDLRFPPRRR